MGDAGSGMQAQRTQWRAHGQGAERLQETEGTRPCRETRHKKINRFIDKEGARRTKKGASIAENGTIKDQRSLGRHPLNVAESYVFWKKGRIGSRGGKERLNRQASCNEKLVSSCSGGQKDKG